MPLPPIPLSRRVAAVLVVAVATVAAVGPVAATSAQAGDEDLRVSAGWDGVARPGELLPVRVTLGGEADGASADVEVQAGNGGTTVTHVGFADDEGVARATAVVLAPRAVAAFDVEVTARRRGEVVATETVRVEPLSDDELVGVLPALARQSPPPESAPLSVPVGSARYVTVDLGTVGVTGALAPIGTLAATGQELAGLDDTQRAALLAWVAQGGRLLVDIPGVWAGSVPGLPDAWQPTAGWTAAGLGEIRLTAGRLAFGGWTMAPTPAITPGEPEVVAPAFSGGPVGASIAQEAGLRIPSIGTILAFLVGYVVLAGPVTFWVLHRLGRAELAWLVVPLLAVGFAVGGFFAGGEARDGTRTAFASSVLETPGADVGLAFIGVLSRDGGDRTITFPGSWWAGNVANEFGGPEADVRADRTGSTTDGTVSLVGGEFAVMAGRGPTAPTRRLRLVAQADGEGVAGTVANDTDRPLRQVAVFVGSRAVQVGDLRPGEERPFRIDQDERRPADQLYVPVEVQVWPNAGGSPTGMSDGPVDLALWGETTSMLGPDLRAPGSAVAVGWSDANLSAPDLRAEAEGRSALVARAPIEPGTVLNGLDVRRDLLRGPDTTDISDGQAPDAGAVFRFVLPAGRLTDPARLRLSVPATLGRVDVWDGLRWTTVFGNDSVGGSPSTSVPPVESFDAQPELVALPPGAVIDGTVHVRLGVRLNAPPDSAANLLLREAP